MRSLFGSMLLVAAGAILVWGVNASVSGISVNTIGAILILVGLVGALVSLLLWASREGFTGRREDNTVPRR